MTGSSVPCAMKTGIDDPSNQQMRVCTECGETLAGDL